MTEIKGSCGNESENDVESDVEIIAIKKIKQITQKNNTLHTVGNVFKYKYNVSKRRVRFT